MKPIPITLVGQPPHTALVDLNGVGALVAFSIADDKSHIFARADVEAESLAQALREAADEFLSKAAEGTPVQGIDL